MTHESAYRRATDALDSHKWLPNLLLRITVGFMFFGGAVDKLADLDKFIAMFVSLGIPAAQVVAPRRRLRSLSAVRR